MKERSLRSTMIVRYEASLVFYISVVIYGAISILLYEKDDMGVVYSGLAVLTSLIAMVSILIKAEGLVKALDPLNKYNHKRYIFIFIIELLEFMAVYYLSVNVPKEKRSFITILFLVITTIITIVIRAIHKSIYNEYERIIKNGEMSKILLDYSYVGDTDIDINWYYKRFIYFIIYIVSLIFVYRYTLYHWALTLGFIAINIYVLWKIHWKGIDYFVNKSKLYFAIICIVSTIGIILLKNIYDGNISLELFNNRDEYEYYMVFVLFYMPIAYYGSKVTGLYSKKNCKWVE